MLMDLNNLNKPAAVMPGMLAATFIVMLLVMLFATNVEARQPTNRNDVTDLFPKEIEDKQGLEGFMESSKASAESGIGSKQGISELGTNESELEGKAKELDTIDANNLESAGQMDRAKPENAYYDTVELDYTDSKVTNHKRDIDKIAEASEKLMSRLIEGLKEHDVDCRQVKGDKEIEPQYFIDVQRDQQQHQGAGQSGDTVYNQTFCEHLRNTYDCSDKLVVRCLDPSEKPEEFEITGYNIAYKRIPRGDITSYEFSNRGAAGKAVRTGGGKGGFLGLGRKDSTTTLFASTANVSFNFNIKIPVATVGRLEIVNLQFTSVLALKINGRTVIVTPGGGDRLVLDGYHEEVDEGSPRYFGVFGSNVKRKTLYPKVATGTSTLILGKINHHNSYGRVSLLPFLREGRNTVEITVIGLNQALVNFTLNASERICRHWQENWEETCTLRVTQP